MKFTKARVQHFAPRRVEGMVTAECAALPCGCAFFVGRRTDNHEVATGASACSSEHAPLIERANGLLLESLARPRRVLLVDVCAQLLSQAAREVGV